MFFKELFNRVEYSFASYLVNPNRGRPNVRNENMHQVKWTVRYDGGGSNCSRGPSKATCRSLQFKKQRETKTLSRFNSLLYTMAVDLEPWLYSANGQLQKCIQKYMYTKKLQFTALQKPKKNRILKIRIPKKETNLQTDCGNLLVLQIAIGQR